MNENEQIQETATCKRCIHKKICVIQAFPDTFENTEWSKKPCDQFKEVRRGEWIETVHDWDFGDYTDYRCSICGTREQNKRPFCPECGANMRGEKE